MTLNEQAKNFIISNKNYLQTSKEKKEVPKIKVDYVASRLASVYEKIRQVIDYQEEHLLRKNAIERMLKRRLFFTKEPRLLSKGLIEEVIRANYFPNESIPEAEIDEVGFVLEKYIFIIENMPPETTKDEKEDIRPWLIKLAACEVEERLVPPIVQEMLFNYAFGILKEKIFVTGKISSFAEKMTPEFKNAQLFIALQKSLLKADESLLYFRLLKFFYPKWRSLEPSSLPEIVQNILKIKKELEEQLKYPLSQEFYHYTVGYSAPFLIFNDVVQENIGKIEEIVQNPEALETTLRMAYEERYKICKTKLTRSGFRSVVSIFLSKVLLAVAIEIPFDAYVVHHFSMKTLGFNLAFPVILMYLIVRSIKAPKRENQEITLLETMRIVYQGKEKTKKEIRLPRKRGWFLNYLLGLIYILTYIVSFGGIFVGLGKLEFSFLSIIIFFIFLCLISFSGLRIKEWSRELKVGEEREGIRAFIIDFFGLPIIKAGKWLSREFSKINLLIVFSNLIFEVPFNTFVEFVQDWRQFAREKKGTIH